MTDKKQIQVFPSILAADFGKLAEEAKRLEDAGADGIHIDIMDGHFVPNLALGPRSVAAIRKVTNLFLDIHLMIYNPYDFVEQFVAAGADGITFHFEATEDIDETLQFIRRCGKKAGLAFRPETSFSMVQKYIALSDMVLLMTVNPGFGGQKFLPEVLEKIRLTRKFCDQNKIRKGGTIPTDGKTYIESAPFDIEVDGGITQESAKRCIDAGANVLVSGSFLYAQKDLQKSIESLKLRP